MIWSIEEKLKIKSFKIVILGKDNFIFILFYTTMALIFLM